MKYHPDKNKSKGAEEQFRQIVQGTFYFVYIVKSYHSQIQTSAGQVLFILQSLVAYGGKRIEPLGVCVFAFGVEVEIVFTVLLCRFCCSFVAANSISAGGFFERNGQLHYLSREFHSPDWHLWILKLSRCCELCLINISRLVQAKTPGDFSGISVITWKFNTDSDSRTW